MKRDTDSTDPRWPHLRGDLAAAFGLLALVTILCAATFLASCNWSVPADPGLNARRRADPPPAASQNVAGPASTAVDDPRARDLYHRHCGRCHEAWHPTYLTAREWPRFVRKYAPRAGLFGEDRQRVLAWLQAHAR